MATCLTLMRSREIETVSVLSTGVGLTLVDVSARVVDGLVTMGTLARESPIGVNTAPGAARVLSEGVALETSTIDYSLN